MISLITIIVAFVFFFILLKSLAKNVISSIRPVVVEEVQTAFDKSNLNALNTLQKIIPTTSDIERVSEYIAEDVFFKYSEEFLNKKQIENMCHRLIEDVMKEHENKTEHHPVSHQKYITALEARLKLMSLDDLLGLDLDLQHLQNQTRFLIRKEAKKQGSR